MLPTPSIDDLLSPAHVRDPYELFTALRTTAPVFRVPDSDLYLVSTWDLVEEASARTEDFSSHLVEVMVSDGGTVGSLNMDGHGTLEHVLATADGAAHKQHRTLVLQTLGKRIRALTAAVDDLAGQLWQTYATDGSIDWVEAVADRLPLAMVAQLIGLPDEDLPQLLSWAYDSTELLGGLVPADRVDALALASIELYTYLDQQMGEAIREPQDDLLGTLARSCISGELESATAVLILLQLVGAGGESTAGLIATAARKLAEDDALQERLRRESELLDRYLDECLRLESPFRGHYRHAVHDTSLGGTAIPAGSTLLLLWGSANRDPERFADPELLDLDREGIRQHLAFGKGVHFCVGSSLARMEATATLRVLLDRTEWISLDPDRPPAWVPSLFVRRHASLPLRFR
ncbi:cytochrome P450 [Nocardioides humilatus]|uniref:Cytochrome P450 n=1 Tax=Nocardioides humilatus TaxID=2607660 RepID=A0A5B1L8Z7_9ACTN|nr:cytochrome P450 [Nocardioides humilatus]KAA1416906.1 cytochrome P450 [Nocardioides humilatus]